MLHTLNVAAKAVALHVSTQQRRLKLMPPDFLQQEIYP